VEHVGTFLFAGEAVAAELELAGVRRLCSPVTVPLTCGTRRSAGAGGFHPRAAR
jgi:hypothetical protein